jgi:hypothetical protein
MENPVIDRLHGTGHHVRAEEKECQTAITSGRGGELGTVEKVELEKGASMQGAG